MLQTAASQEVVHAVNHWFDDTPLKESQSEWHKLLDKYGPVTVVSALAAIKWDDVHALLDRLVPINRKRKVGRPVKTVGVYYYRLRNGGIERCISLLVPLWQKAGYNVVFIAEEPATLEDYTLPEGTPRVIIKKASNSKKEAYVERAENWEAIVSTYHLDTIVYKAWESPLLFWDALCLKSLNLNLVVESHNTFSCLFRLQMPHRYELPFTYRLVDRVVVLSRVFARFWNNYCPAYYIPNVTTLCPKEKCATLHSQTILWVGRIAREKHPLDAVKIFAQIHKSNPNATMIMVGGGDDPTLQHELEQEIQTLALENCIQLTGYTTNVTPYYQKAALLLFTSDYEGFPMVLAEAKSYGLPIIMYDLPYLEMARDQRGIIAVAQGDIKSMAENATDLLSEDGTQKRLQLGEQSRKSAEDFASFDQIGAWKRVFDSLQKPEEAEAQMASVDEQLMMELLLSEIACGEKNSTTILKNVLEGKAWLESHSEIQEKVIKDQQRAWEERGEALKQVQEAKEYLAYRCNQQEEIILEQAKALSCALSKKQNGLIYKLVCKIKSIFRCVFGVESL